jgi:hypothetical protein
VDELGGIDRAIELVKQRAKLQASDKIKLVAYPPRKTLLQILTNREDLTALESRIVDLRMQARVEERLGTVAEDPSVRLLLRALMTGALPPGGIMSLMPYRVTIH